MFLRVTLKKWSAYVVLILKPWKISSTFYKLENVQGDALSLLKYRKFFPLLLCSSVPLQFYHSGGCCSFLIAY